MLEYIYLEEEQRFFTNSQHTLAVLSLSRELLSQGVCKHLALSGFRRMGENSRSQRVLALQPAR